jgi:hypothetical protein
VQLDQLVLRETRRQFPELSVLTRLTRVKFKRLNRPGELIDLRLERRGPVTVHFTLEVADQPAASGILYFAPPAGASSVRSPAGPPGAYTDGEAP